MKKTVKGFLEKQSLGLSFFMKNSLKRRVSSLKNLDTQKNIMYNISNLYSAHPAREK